MHAPKTDDYDAGAEPLADHIAGLKTILEREVADLGIESLPSEKEADQALATAQESAHEDRDTQTTARAALGGPEEEMGRVQTELGSVKTRYDDGKERLDKLKKGLAEAEEQVSDDDLEAGVTTARKALADQEKAVSELEGQREGETLPQLEARISRLETALQERRDKRSDLKEKVVGLQSHIEALEGAGLDEAIQQKKREVELADDQRQRYEREVTVLTLLLSTFEHLSMGTQEQIAVLVRLAFAEMLVEQGHPATVVLDDALVFSDDRRMGRMFDILNMVARQVQIIVLTCREQLFEGVGGRQLSMKPASGEELVSA